MEVILELSGHPKANVKKVVITDTVVVGRSQKCGLQIASAAVSRRHCEIRIGHDNVSVIDLGSSNGTFIDSQRLPPGEETALPSGARLNVGGVRFVVQHAGATSTNADLPAVGAGVAVPSDPADAADGVLLFDDDQEAVAVAEPADLSVPEEAPQDPVAAEPFAESLDDEASRDIEEPALAVEPAAETLQPIPEMIDDEPDLEAMFAASPSAPVSDPVSDTADEDVPIIEEDEAFAFLTDEEPATTQRSSKEAQDSRLGDFLSQLGRD
jgi:predicted component of type VI protein secretion system